MILLILSVSAFAMAAAVTVLVCLANGMSDVPTQPFEGGGAIVLFWLVSAGFWGAWLLS